MIAKIPPRRRDGGSSFRALGDYVLGRTGHSAGAVLHIGMQNVNSVGTAAQEMEALAIENTILLIGLRLHQLLLFLLFRQLS